MRVTDDGIDYRFRVSRRARRLSLAVYSDARVVVVAPPGFSLEKAKKFFLGKLPWIKSKLEYFKSNPQRLLGRGSRREYLQHRHRARQLMLRRLSEINKFYNFKFRRVSVKNQKTRWGSCSKQGNLNFNYRVVFLPLPLVDYLAAHELCHLKEFNHGRKFWELVSLSVPDYKKLKKELRAK